MFPSPTLLGDLAFVAVVALLATLGAALVFAMAARLWPSSSLLQRLHTPSREIAKTLPVAVSTAAALVALGVVSQQQRQGVIVGSPSPLRRDAFYLVTRLSIASDGLSGAVVDRIGLRSGPYEDPATGYVANPAAIVVASQTSRVVPPLTSFPLVIPARGAVRLEVYFRYAPLGSSQRSIALHVRDGTTIVKSFHRSAPSEQYPLLQAIGFSCTDGRVRSLTYRLKGQKEREQALLLTLHIVRVRRSGPRYTMTQPMIASDYRPPDPWNDTVFVFPRPLPDGIYQYAVSIGSTALQAGVLGSVHRRGVSARQCGSLSRSPRKGG